MVISEKETKYVILECDNQACRRRECRRVDGYEDNPPMNLELFPNWHFGHVRVIAISVSGSALPANSAREQGFHACCIDCIPGAVYEVVRSGIENGKTDGIH